MKTKMKFKSALLIALASLTALSSCNNDNNDDPTPVEANEYDYKVGSTVYTVKKDDKVVVVKDNGDGTGTVTWSADTTYVLDGRVFVNDGDVLTIEAGTMVQGKPGQGENSSVLIVARGAKIMAEGTAADPIVFTGLNDTKDGSAYGKRIRGIWGGLIILGKATTNNSADKNIEGIPNEPRSVYGGSDDADNSGVLKYVSIRHGGTEIGADNEINGLTLGAVGSGTVFENIEVVSNLDDGIEFFGGAAQLKRVLVAYVGDDSYDYDEGFHGKGQFWVALQDANTGDRCAEQDGGTGDDEQATPYAKPTIYNATYIGNGGPLMIFRDNAGGTYANSIFANIADGVRIEYRNDKDNSYDRLIAGDLTIKNNIMQDLVAGEAVYVKPDTDKGPEPADADANALAEWNDNGNTIASVGLRADGDDAGVNLIPTSGATSGVAATDSWFEATTAQGAFPNGTDWTSWTYTFK